jgi:hypothetical protein
MSRKVQVFLSGVFMAIIFAVPISQAGLDVYLGRLPQFADVFTQVPTRSNLRAFEKDLEGASVYAKAIRPWIQSVFFLALRDPGDKAVMGRDGWLFYRPDVQYLLETDVPQGDTGSGTLRRVLRVPPPVEPAPTFEDPVSAIVNFREQLYRQGIHLLVLPMPGKPSVYPDKLTRRGLLQGRDFVSPTRRLISMLRTSGVETVDLFETFLLGRQARLDVAEPYYLAQDTHWSGAGVRIAAQVVAHRLLELGWVQTGSTDYEVKPVLLRRQGDIIRMVNVPSLEWTFPAEQLHCFQVFEGERGNLYKDEISSTVLLLGDSFFRIYETDEPGSAGFIAHLARELRAPLSSIVNDGGASTLVRQQLGRRPGLLRGKKVVIWEFVERDIRFGTDGWKYVPLPGDRE